MLICRFFTTIYPVLSGSQLLRLNCCHRMFTISSIEYPRTINSMKLTFLFSILFQALKIMLHRPFICGTPSMESLQNSQNSRLVHLQSATFSAIRVSYIVNSFRNFYPLVSFFFPFALIYTLNTNLQYSTDYLPWYSRA